MPRAWWIATLVLLGCAKEVHDPIGGAVDFADPKSVVGAVIFAARTGETGGLARLCGPDSEPSVRRICALTPRSADWPSFRAAFEGARLNGEPRIHDDHAALNFVFGPGATASETMELSRAGGRWTLLRF